jgi:hypothetical protein
MTCSYIWFVCISSRSVSLVACKRISVILCGTYVLTEQIKKIAVFWVVALCSLVEVYQRFRGPCCLHHQGDEYSSSYSPPWEPPILLNKLRSTTQTSTWFRPELHNSLEISSYSTANSESSEDKGYKHMNEVQVRVTGKSNLVIPELRSMKQWDSLVIFL